MMRIRQFVAVLLSTAVAFGGGSLSGAGLVGPGWDGALYCTALGLVIFLLHKLIDGES